MSVLFSVPSAPVVRIESAGESTAGINHTLTCTVTLEQDLRAPLLIQWTAPNGSIIENKTLVDVTVSKSSNNLSLTFAPLHTSHGGQYFCMASVNVSEANVFISGQASLNITVQSIIYKDSLIMYRTYFLSSFSPYSFPDHHWVTYLCFILILMKKTILASALFLYSDINECANAATCDSNATCTNTPGSYNCTCNQGYTGNGTTCEGKSY